MQIMILIFNLELVLDTDHDLNLHLGISTSADHDHNLNLYLGLNPGTQIMILKHAPRSSFTDPFLSLVIKSILVQLQNIFFIS